MWFLTLTLLCALATVLYLYLIWNFNYWKKRGVCGPKPKALFGTVPNIILQKRNFYYDLHDSYVEFKGNAFAGIFLMRTPQLLAIEPDFIKNVMITNFKNFHENDFFDVVDKETDPIFGRNPFFLQGEEWKEKRAEITPAFTPSRIKALHPLIEDIGRTMTKYLKLEAAKQPIDGMDCKELAAKYTTDVVSSCIFGTDANSYTDSEAIIRKMGKEMMIFNWETTLYFIITFLFPLIKKFWKKALIKRNVEIFFIDLMKKAIVFRERNKVERVDYLNFLIQLKDKKKLNSLDLAAHGVTFFVDGFETSSIVISYGLYELARNKDVQEKLRNEIKEHGKFDYDNMPYLDQVFYEVLRLHPPLYNLNRRCTETIEVTGARNKKLLIKKGMAINIPIRSLHTDPDYYKNPENFYPERFDPENGGVKAFKERGVLLPFGDGPRICLGMRFATVLVKSAWADIIFNFELSVNKKTREPLELDPSELLTTPVGGLWVDFQEL